MAAEKMKTARQLTSVTSPTISALNAYRTKIAKRLRFVANKSVNHVPMTKNAIPESSA